MSLIERAVGRLSTGTGGNASADLGSRAEAAKLEAGPGSSTVESLVDRIAASGEGILAKAPEPGRKPARSVEIDLKDLRARGFVMPDGEQSRVAQEFRVIKRPLLANAFGKGVAPVRNGKRIMVTSAFPGEGKSFNAINLALSIAAERDHKVLLVDADVARPSVPRELGIQVDAGLMDWLIDGTLDVADLVLQTNVDKLAILPAGRRHEHATELLASAAMTRLLDQISARFPDRVVIFDSPPLLVTTESRVLASYMGQIVMVVEAGSTPRAAVQEALSTIEGSEVVGMVLNKSKGTQGSGYGGYYGYGYGYGSK